jgi:hypothetical protein
MRGAQKKGLRQAGTLEIILLVRCIIRGVQLVGSMIIRVNTV